MQNLDENLSEQNQIVSSKVVTDQRRDEILWQESRLSLPFALRLPLATAIGFVSGTILGIGHGSKIAALRFRAENSHRLPTTPTGWYLYHKSKNYHTILGGVKEGAGMGLRLSTWTAAFFIVENIFDRWRGEKDFLNTIGGGLAVAGGFSWWNSMPAPTAARTAKLSLVVGLAYGLAQDVISLARGRELSYVNFILRGFSKDS
ncbi:hypothetical protein HI914_02779 [Erysiphe necator]|uniref:Uncharacterized protein n=1 Tax=Uncinula necator TaxID=52586 RepID=A0A0B1PFA1_UNCNE|nr:hypothetical protein HI914_02779 [Erysiphe necator]KHJ35259.1 hypothetical protein EV44_g2336 [Erysiphe necator]